MKLEVTCPPARVYEFGDFRLDTRKRLLWRDGAQVPLTPRVFETLLYLVEHHDSVLDKERLMEAVWPDSIVEENNLTQNISTLRRVFGETRLASLYCYGAGTRLPVCRRRHDARRGARVCRE